MAFEVRSTRRADRDIADKEAFVSALGLPALIRWRGRFFRVVQILETDPHRFPAADESADLPIDLRQALFGRGRHVYRILFTIQSDTVTVHRVRHASQDYLIPDEL